MENRETLKNKLKTKPHKPQTLILAALLLLILTITVVPSFNQKTQAAADPVSDNRP